MIIQETREVTITYPQITSAEIYSFIEDHDVAMVNKINTIKHVRAEFGIGLKEAKELVETVWETSKAIRKLASVEFKTLGSEPIETPITMNEVKDAYDKCYSTQLPLEREAVAITDYNADTYSDAQIEEGDDLPW